MKLLICFKHDLKLRARFSKRGKFRELENQPTKNLPSRLIRWGLIGQTTLAVLLLVPGTLHFLQGWAFMAVNFAVSLAFCIYFYRRDRELLACRMLR